MNFLDDMKKKAKASKKRIVLPEGTDLRVLTAAKEGLAEIFYSLIVA